MVDARLYLRQRYVCHRVGIAAPGLMAVRCTFFDFRNLAFRNPDVHNPLRASNGFSAYAQCT
ncbi:MAG: hypothetical protein ACLQVM_14090 [Terriglobia bacterium]